MGETPASTLPTLSGSRYFRAHDRAALEIIAKAKAAELAAAEAAALPPVKNPPGYLHVKRRSGRPKRGEAHPDPMAGLTKGRMRMLRIMAGRAIGKSNDELIEQLKISRSYFNLLCKRMRTSGEWVMDSAERLDRMGVPLAIDNVVNGLEKGDERTKMKYSLEILKGRGVLRTEDNAVKQPQQVLAVRIEMPSGGQVIAAEGAIVGTPNVIDRR